MTRSAYRTTCRFALTGVDPQGRVQNFPERGWQRQIVVKFHPGKTGGQPCGAGGCGVDTEFDGAMRELMGDVAGGVNIDEPGEHGGGNQVFKLPFGESIVGFHAGDLPCARPERPDRASADQHAMARGDDQRRHGHGAGRSAWARAGDFVNESVLACFAEITKRAGIAARLPGRTHGRAEFHQRLIEVAAVAGGQSLEGQVPKAIIDARRTRIVSNGHHAQQHALDVAVEQGRSLIERDGGDRSRGIAANARKLHQTFDGARKFAVQVVDDPVGGFVQQVASAVVSQSGPEREHVGSIGAGQVLDGWKTLEESQIVGDHGGHLGLVQHQLGDELCVGIVLTAPPGQIPAMASVPG